MFGGLTSQAEVNDTYKILVESSTGKRPSKRPRNACGDMNWIWRIILDSSRWKYTNISGLS